MTENDYHRITAQAYQELIDQGCRCFPVHPSRFSAGNRLILSTQEYEQMAHLPDRALLNAACEDDGCIIRQIRPGLDLILYNRETYLPRARFTILHEIGHSRLLHTERGPQQEAEAHFFAAQTLAPDALLRVMEMRGFRLTETEISLRFGMSAQAAMWKLADYRWAKRFAPSTMDSRLLWHFQAYLRMLGSAEIRLSMAAGIITMD